MAKRLQLRLKRLPFGEKRSQSMDTRSAVHVLVSRSTGSRPVKLASGLMAPADLVVDRKRGWLIVPENAGNRLSVYELTKFNSSDT
jgi:hypothetical protein